MYKVYTLLLFCLLALKANAQTLPNWSSYYENGFIWNPALTAYWSDLEVTLSHRQDWSGFEDAPETSAIGVQFPFLRRTTRVSIGAYLESDKVGPFSRNSASFTYNYRLVPKLFGSRLDQLRLGIAFHASQLAYNPNKLLPYDGFEGDPDIIQQPEGGWASNVTFGVFYTNIDDFNNLKDHFYVGMSINQAVPVTIGLNTLGRIRSQPHATLNIGRRIMRTYRSKKFWDHNLLLIYSFQKTFNVMVSSKFEYPEKYWVSGGAVSNGELFVQGGVMFGDDSFLSGLLSGGLLKLGFKADHALTALRPYTGVGYEVYMAYLFNMDKKW